jgi:hypothetical protein
VQARAAPGAKRTDQKRVREVMKVRIRIPTKKEMTLRCKWKKGSIHGDRMDPHPTGNKLQRKGRRIVALRKTKIKTDGVGRQATCVKGAKIINQGRTNNLKQLKSRLGTKEGLTVHSVGSRTTCQKIAEGRLLVKNVWVEQSQCIQLQGGAALESKP